MALFCDRMSEPRRSAGKGVGQLEAHGELLEELVEGLNALRNHVSDLDRRLALPLCALASRVDWINDRTRRLEAALIPGGAAARVDQAVQTDPVRVPSGAAAAARVDQAVQAEPVRLDKSVQAWGTLPLKDLLVLLEAGEEQRLLDDLVGGGGSPVPSTGTVASYDAVDSPPDVGRHHPVLHRSASCPELQPNPSVSVSSSSSPRRPVSGASTLSSPVPRSSVRASPSPTAPRPRVPVDDSAAAEPEWTPSEGRRMPLQERDRRMRQGLCLYCAERGHHINECPIRPSFSYGQ